MSNRSFGRARSPEPEAPPLRRGSARTKFRDARRSSRQRMVMPGKLYFGLTVQAVDCLIGDMSVGGARVRVKPGTVVLDDLYFVHLRQWAAYKARVAWRRPDGNLGLQFTRSYDLDGAVAPELRVMREYCVAYDNLR